MDSLDDDVLALVLIRVENRADRKACALVSRQWLRVEGRTRTSLRMIVADAVPKILPRYRNLTALDVRRGLRDSDLECIAKHCPSLKSLNLALSRRQVAAEVDRESFAFSGGDTEADGVGDIGLTALASGCQRIQMLRLRWRVHIGDKGVSAVASKCTSLQFLDISHCKRVTDSGLKALAGTSQLRVLILSGSNAFTDTGLRHLAEGPLQSSLTHLELEDCDQISDAGVSCLSSCACLQLLNLAECGPRVTDAAMTHGLAGIGTLQSLNLARLMNISDHAIAELASRCSGLRQLGLTGCEGITDMGITALSRCKLLQVLELADCPNVTGGDVAMLAQACSRLRSLSLSHSLRPWVDSLALQRLNSQGCLVKWQ